jgi:hypothetical protein
MSTASAASQVLIDSEVEPVETLRSPVRFGS